jgi:putative AlgH/UPF0301 family transcriptional regulator
MAKNGTPIISKLIYICPHDENPNIGLSDIVHELLDELKLPDFMEK